MTALLLTTPPGRAGGGDAPLSLAGESPLLLTGDCLPLLAGRPAVSADLTVTSPPYDKLCAYDTPVSLDLYHRHAAPGPWWRTRFRVDHEFVFLFLKGDRHHTFHKETLYISTKHAVERVTRKPFARRGTPWGDPPPTILPLQCRGTVWPYAASSAERNRLKLTHPATMPDALARDLIRCFSGPGELVLDPMMGSGTTGVMGARLGRRSVGMDASPAYVGIARRRLDVEAGTPQAREEGNGK